MIKKKFRVEFEALNWYAIIEVDEAFVPEHGFGIPGFTTRDVIKTMVEFWTGWEHELLFNDGDYLKTFLQQLGREIVLIQADDSMAGTDTVIGEFKGREGWSRMDGSFGIKILAIQPLDLDPRDFSIEEVEG
jgi:hypothetical protein